MAPLLGGELVVIAGVDLNGGKNNIEGKKEKKKKEKEKKIRQTVAKIARGTFKGPSTILHYQFTSCVPPVPSEPVLYGAPRLPEAERRLSQVQAGVGGRLHKRIFGTRCEATICVKVQLGDTQIRRRKRTRRS